MKAVKTHFFFGKTRSICFIMCEYGSRFDKILRAYPEIIRTPIAPRLFRHIASVSLAGRQPACGKPPNLAKNPRHNRRTSNFEIGSKAGTELIITEYLCDRDFYEY